MGEGAAMAMAMARTRQIVVVLQRCRDRARPGCPGRPPIGRVAGAGSRRERGAGMVDYAERGDDCSIKCYATQGHASRGTCCSSSPPGSPSSQSPRWDVDHPKLH